MDFSQFIKVDAIITDLQAKTKNEAIREMVETLAKSAESHGVAEGDVEDVIEDVIAAIIHREELGSTGIGNGVAVPHAKHSSMTNLVGAIAIAPDEGVDFCSLDSQPVKLFFLLVSPPDNPGDHLRALEHITRQLKVEGFAESLMDATTPEAVKEILDKADAHMSNV